MDSPTSKRQEAALAILRRVLDDAGSGNKAVLLIKARTGLDVTEWGLRKALQKGRVGDPLMKIAEALSKAAPAPTSQPANERAPQRSIVYDDPYPNRPPAVALLRGLIEDESVESLLSVRERTGDMAIEDWVNEGLRLQKERERIRTQRSEPAAPAPAAPLSVSPADLKARREKMKPRKR